MRRSWFVVGVAVLVAAYLARRLVTRSGGFGWEQMIERMPDTAPPKWMFNNIQAIRANTDRILERLAAEPATAGS
jgi:hypothetical protein